MSRAYSISGWIFVVEVVVAQLHRLHRSRTESILALAQSDDRRAGMVGSKSSEWGWKMSNEQYRMTSNCWTRPTTYSRLICDALNDRRPRRIPIFYLFYLSGIKASFFFSLQPGGLLVVWGSILYLSIWYIGPKPEVVLPSWIALRLPELWRWSKGAVNLRARNNILWHWSDSRVASYK